MFTRFCECVGSKDAEMQMPNERISRRGRIKRMQKKKHTTGNSNRNDDKTREKDKKNKNTI